MANFRYKAQKKTHIRNVMERMEESGQKCLSGAKIAQQSGYAYSMKFLELLFEMVDDELLRMNVLPYRVSGRCTVKYEFYLPANYVEK